MTYQEATGRLGRRDRRKVANNTYLERRTAETIAVRLHATDVVTLHANGDVVLDTGGWKTVTTKDRLNHYSGHSVYSNRGTWLVDGEHVYADGITFHADGSVSNAGAPDTHKQEMSDKRTARQYAKAFVAQLQVGHIPAPSAGDCWFCGMQTTDGKSLGEATHDSDHLRSHLDERYYVPSLAVNATKAFGASSVEKDALTIGFILADPKHPQHAEVQTRLSNGSRAFYDIGFRQLEKHIYRYVCRQLGMAA